MSHNRNGQIAVIFVSKRTGADAAGYSAAAAAMDALAALQPGYCGIDDTHDSAGVGITISYWADEASAKAWRDNPEHVAIRETGRAIWYDWYKLYVSEVRRGYSWRRP